MRFLLMDNAHSYYCLTRFFPKYKRTPSVIGRLTHLKSRLLGNHPLTPYSLVRREPGIPRPGFVGADPYGVGVSWR